MALGSQALRPYKTFQADEGRVLMRDLLNDPLNFAHHFERYAASLVSILGWGRRIDKVDDYILKFALKMMDEVTTMQVPGLYWMEAIPEMQYLPSWIYPLPTQLRNFGCVLRNFWWALDNESAAKEVESFSKTLISSREKEGLSPEEIGEMTANLFGGGLDTTSSTLHTLILGLCLFPDAIENAHMELDAVVGKDRSPNWDDIENLPYCQAVLKEAMRWRSVTALGGFAHAPVKDDVYKGYKFPAGIHVYGNLWGIHHNSKDFPDPHTFRPERFLDERLPYPTKSGHHAFGWGRRTCSGQYFAEQGLSMTVARLLWAFDIMPGLDEKVSCSFTPQNRPFALIEASRWSFYLSSVGRSDYCLLGCPRLNMFANRFAPVQGQALKLDMWAYTDAENTQPLPFKARFIARTPEIRDLVDREASEARERLRKWDGVSNVAVEQFM